MVEEKKVEQKQEVKEKVKEAPKEAKPEAKEEKKEEKEQTVKKTNLVYAALLLNSASKPVNEENIKKITSVLDEKIDDAQIKALVAALEGVDIDDVISKAAMPVAASAPVAEAKTEEKKEEVSEEDKEKKAEQAAEGLSSLFG